MKMSKKIFSLLLALCVLCTAVPAFARTEVIDNGLLPVEGITMENIDMLIGQQTWVTATDETAAAVLKNKDFASRGTIEGSFTVAGETFAFTTRNIEGYDNTLGCYVYATSLIANSADLKAAIENEKENVAGTELQADGTAYLTGGQGKRNMKRYFLTKLGVDYSELDDGTLANYNIKATATVTVKDKQAGRTEIEVGNLPEGTLFLASSKISNDLPSTWQSTNGVYQQKSEQGDSGVDGTWAVFTAPETGTYTVWATKRDRTTDGLNQRDMFLDVSGTQLSFDRATKADGSTYVSSTLAYYWEPELNGTTVSFTKGQQVYVRMLSKTGNYAGSYGFVFIPADEDVTPDMTLGGSGYTQSIADQFNLLSVGTSTTPHTGSALVSKAVTVNGKDVTATERTAFAAFPRVRQYDMNGNYLATATVMDAIVAGDAADDSYDLSARAATETMANISASLHVTVNGIVCANPDRVAVNDGDVITVEPINKTNFAPIPMGGVLTGNGGKTNSDGLVIAGVGDGWNMKFVTNQKSTNFTWPVDSTAVDAFKDCYLNGYITIGKDVADTTGDDTKITIFVKDLKIVHSAVRESDGRLELGVVAPSGNDITFVDGLTYVSPYIPGNGNMQKVDYGFNLSHFYLTNTKSAADTEVAAVKTADGVYTLTTNKSTAVVLYRITKDAAGKVTGASTEYKVLDFMGNGETVTVGDNETVYVWEGSFMKDAASASLKPLCAPLTK